MIADGAKSNYICTCAYRKFITKEIDTFLSKVQLKDTYSRISVVCVSIIQYKASLSILNAVRNRKLEKNKIKHFLKKLPWNPINMDTKGTCHSARIILVSV